jgi:hypothetical protein
MAERQTDLHYRVVGIRRDGTRDARYGNLSLQTAEQVRFAMVQAQLYREVVVEDQSLVRQFLDAPSHAHKRIRSRSNRGRISRRHRRAG